MDQQTIDTIKETVKHALDEYFKPGACKQEAFTSNLWTKKKPVKPKTISKKNPWISFSGTRRKEIKENFPKLTFVEVTKKLSMEWSSMPPEEKRKYE